MKRITTEEMFMELAESWYQRTHRLREIAENETELPERKKKALKLFLIMAGRMQKIGLIACRMRLPKPPRT